jgi:hypothetical protein
MLYKMQGGTQLFAALLDHWIAHEAERPHRQLRPLPSTAQRPDTQASRFGGRSGMRASGGRRLSDAARRARDRLILEDRSRGTSWAELAERYSLSERQVRRAAASAARLAAERGLDELDPDGILEAIPRAQLRALHRLEELASESAGAVAVGAARAVGPLGSDLRQTLIATGLVAPPKDAWLRAQLNEGVAAIVRAAAAAQIPSEAIYAELDREPAIRSRGLALNGDG